MTDKCDMVTVDYMGAAIAGDNRHAQKITQDLGIKYAMAVPQTIVDSWWFLVCESVPEELPSYVKRRDVASFRDFVGHGLTEADADRLEALRRDPIEEPDINVCPSCGGYADNGFDRGLPPSPYYCTKCMDAKELRAKLAIAEDQLTEARAECERLRETLRKALRVVADVLVHKCTPETWKLAYRVKSDARKVLG